jgi:hypothetical protein
MEPNKVFKVFELVIIGVLSGLAVSLVKLIQAGFYRGDPSGVELQAALFTYAAYLVLGALGAVFMVDHDSKGQKMLKGAFLTGLMAPSFFLAALSQPVSHKFYGPYPAFQIPKLGELLIGSAHAQTPEKPSLHDDLKSGEIFTLDRDAVAPKFSDSVWRAFGVNVSQKSFTYVVGTTSDRLKAVATAQHINELVGQRGTKFPLKANVVQPEGLRDYFVTIGAIDDPRNVAFSAKAAREIAFDELSGSASPETKRYATLILKGQIVDANSLFVAPDQETGTKYRK